MSQHWRVFSGLGASVSALALFTTVATAQFQSNDVPDTVTGQTDDERANDAISDGLSGFEGELDTSDEDDGTQPRLAPLFVPGIDAEDEQVVTTEEAIEESEESEDDLIEQPAVMLRGLDKITGAATDFAIARDEQMLLGGLRVTVRACHQTPPTEPPESIAYLEVEDFGFSITEDDVKDEEIDAEKRVFNGWMYASSPGIHGLEHPIYDIWVIRCMAEAPERSETDSDS